MKVVLDGGNGMAGPMVRADPRRPCRSSRSQTYWEPDGEFPDHEPNPLLEENRRFIIDKVLAEGADLGIAWDGDADRCFFIDDTGEFVDGDFLTALLAAVDPARRSRARRSSTTCAPPGPCATWSRRAGGTAHVNRVGHAFFKTRMRDEGAAFGGEVSGHYYFRDFYCADSGTLPALLILELLRQARRDASASCSRRCASATSSPARSTPRSPTRTAKMDEIEERYADGEITELDGVSVDYDDWHFNVRPSNTEPLLRLNLESLVSREHMEEKRDEVLALIRA